jgi:hypothetical protein
MFFSTILPIIGALVASFLYTYIKLIERFNISGFKWLNAGLEAAYKMDSPSVLKWVLKIGIVACLVRVFVF